MLSSLENASYSAQVSELMNEFFIILMLMVDSRTAFYLCSCSIKVLYFPMW